MKITIRKPIVLLLGLAILFSMGIGPAQAQIAVQTALAGTGFTYQGQITRAGSPYSGTCDLTFSLWDAASGGSQLGTQTISGKAVSGGVFSVQLNEAGQFGASAFDGSPRWLEVSVKCGGDSSATSLGRQALTAAPYALTAGNALQLGGKNASAFQPRGKNVVVVSPTGGDFSSIQAALTSITDASATNPYLVWVGPGVYTEQIQMKPYVDIEGAGEDVTKISYHGSTHADQGTVVGADNAELRFLTVENTGDTYAIAVGIYCWNKSPRLTHLTVTASGSATAAIGVYVGGGSSAPTLREARITATGGQYPEGIFVGSNAGFQAAQVKVTVYGGTNTNTGMFFDQSKVILDGMDITASSSPGATSYGIEVSASSAVWIKNSIVNSLSDVSGANYGIFSTSSSGSQSIIVQQSQIYADGKTLYETGSSTTIQVGGSLLSGGSTTPSGGTLIIKCAGVYDEGFTFYTSSCPG